MYCKQVRISLVSARLRRSYDGNNKAELSESDLFRIISRSVRLLEKVHIRIDRKRYPITLACDWNCYVIHERSSGGYCWPYRCRVRRQRIPGYQHVCGTCRKGPLLLLTAIAGGRGRLSRLSMYDYVLLWSCKQKPNLCCSICTYMYVYVCIKFYAIAMVPG